MRRNGLWREALTLEAIRQMMHHQGRVEQIFEEASTWWLEQARPYTPKEIATRSARLASALFKEASTWQ